MLQTSLKGKRRNVEKRREKSRYAARSRREKEAGIFTDLYETVPIVSESTITHVDRIAVLRLAATFCRVRRVAEKVFPTSTISKAKPEANDLFAEKNINECLEGFFMLVDSSGLIIYISPNCSRSLGLTQTDLIGQNIHEYLHLDDSLEFVSTLENAAITGTNTILRMKSVLSPRGRNLTLKSAIFRAVAFSVNQTVVEFPPVQPRRPASRNSPTTGEISDFEDEEEGMNCSDSPVTTLDSTYFVMHGVPIPHCSAGTTGDYFGPGTFMTRHTMDMKFSYCHERLSDYLGFDSKSLMGSSFHALVHPEDVSCLTTSLKELYKKGYVNTTYYRIMVKSGGFVWVTTSANTVTHTTRGHGGQYVVCIHQIVSFFSPVERSDVTADVQQTAPALLCKLESDRKVKQSKIIGPTAEQLLQRAPTVTDYIPLTNPASPPGFFAGPPYASIDHLKSHQQGKSQDHNEPWLFRAVGGIEKRKARQRRNGDCSNATAGSGQLHVGTAAKNHSRAFKGSNVATGENTLCLPTVIPFDTVAQHDIQQHLFATMPSTGFQSASSVIRREIAIDGFVEKRQKGKDELISLAPFIHHTDEIPLDFGQEDNNTGLPLDLLNDMKLEFDDVNSIAKQYDVGSNGLPNYVSMEDIPGMLDTSAKDELMEKEIETIYRYLREDGDNMLRACGNRSMAESSIPPLINWSNSGIKGPPPLLVMDRIDDQKSYGLSFLKNGANHCGLSPGKQQGEYDTDLQLTMQCSKPFYGHGSGSWK